MQEFEGRAGSRSPSLEVLQEQQLRKALRFRSLPATAESRPGAGGRFASRRTTSQAYFLPATGTPPAVAKEYLLRRHVRPKTVSLANCAAAEGTGENFDARPQFASPSRLDDDGTRSFFQATPRVAQSGADAPASCSGIGCGTVVRSRLSGPVGGKATAITPAAEAAADAARFGRQDEDALPASKPSMQCEPHVPLTSRVPELFVGVAPPREKVPCARPSFEVRSEPNRQLMDCFAPDCWRSKVLAC